MYPCRRLVLMLLFGVSSVACTPVMKGIGDGLLLATGVGQPALESKATQPRIGYLKVVSGQQALFVLGYVQAGQEVWYGPGPSVMTMTHGIVQRTSGLGDDLLSEQWLGDGARYLTEGLHTLPVNASIALTKRRSQSKAYRWHVDDRYVLTHVGRERVKAWAGAEREAIRVEETPVETAWPGNTYWVQPETGEIIASQQWLSPERRFALVPREPHERRTLALTAAPEANTVSSQRIQKSQRLSEWLLEHPAYINVLPANLHISTTQWPSTASRQLQQRVLLDLRQAQAATRGDAQKNYIDLAAWLASGQARPRVAVIATDPYWLRASPTHDLVLQPGDEIRVLEAQRHVDVVRADGRRCAAPFKTLFNIQDYLTACDSHNSTLDAAWMLQPDGRISEQGIATWNKSPSVVPAPGAWLVLLPNDYARHAGDTQAAKHLMQLLSLWQEKP